MERLDQAERYNRLGYKAIKIVDDIEREGKRHLSKRLPSTLSTVIRSCLVSDRHPTMTIQQMFEDGPIRHYLLHRIDSPLVTALSDGYPIPLDRLQDVPNSDIAHVNLQDLTERLSYQGQGDITNINIEQPFSELHSDPAVAPVPSNAQLSFEPTLACTELSSPERKTSPWPKQRGDFQIAIICALPHEADAVELLFDAFYDDQEDENYVHYGRAAGDTNSYTIGRMGNHSLVLLVLPSIGSTSASAAAAGLRSSFVNIKLDLLVGACGGIPTINGQEVVLGDVVVGKRVVRYDYGTQYPGHFEVKGGMEDVLGRSNADIRGLLSKISTERSMQELQKRAMTHLKSLQASATSRGYKSDYTYLGPNEDRLFPSDFRHIHRQQLPFTPQIFLGGIGSGNTVMKSGGDGDRIATELDIIAFEMESAGIWDEVPSIVVKGICDYADSHKNKKWQSFAAATAASIAKAILERYA